MLSSWGGHTVIFLGVLYFQEKNLIYEGDSIFRDSLRTHKIVPRTLTILNLFLSTEKLFDFPHYVKTLPTNLHLKKKKKKGAANKAKHSITSAIILQDRMREATTCD